MRRDCVTVIKQMIDIIPEKQTQLRYSLEWNIEDARYKAPEDTAQWQSVWQTLKTYIFTPKEDWEWEVLSIFTTKSAEELKSDKCL